MNAPKRLAEESIPLASSSKELEKSENGSKEVSDCEEVDHEEDYKASVQKPALLASSKGSKPQESSKTDEKSESESDCDSDKTQPSPSASDFTIRPIVSNAINDYSNPRKNLQYPLVASFTPISSRSKRPAESDPAAKISKKKKNVSNGDDEEGRKSSGFQRLWSEDDEISILKGMINYQSKKGSDPSTDTSAFHDFIRKDIHVDVSKYQLMDKVRKLKKKYRNIVEKANNGEDPVFSKPHDYKSFELSEKIWGPRGKENLLNGDKEISNSISPTSTEQVKSVEMVREAQVNEDGKIIVGPDEFLSDYPWLDGSFKLEDNKLWPQCVMRLVREAMPLIGGAKAKALDERWRKLNEDKLELWLKKIELVREQGELVLDSIRSSKD